MNKISKTICPKCLHPKMTVHKQFPQAVYILTDCKNCGLWKAFLSDGQKTESVYGEWSRHARLDLEANAKDVLQPIKGTSSDGKKVINRNFVEAHGTKSIEKNYQMTREQILERAE